MGIPDLRLTTLEVQESGELAWTFSLKAPCKDSKLVDAARRYVGGLEERTGRQLEALPGHMELRSREMKAGLGWRAPHGQSQGFVNFVEFSCSSVPKQVTRRRSTWRNSPLINTWRRRLRGLPI